MGKLMDITEIKDDGWVIPKCKCERCGHTWFIRKARQPVVCPACYSPYWNIPRKNGEEEHGEKKVFKQTMQAGI